MRTTLRDCVDCGVQWYSTFKVPASVLRETESSVADCGLRFDRIGVGFRCIFFFQSTDPMNAGACVAWGPECNEADTGKAVLEGERGALA